MGTRRQAREAAMQALYSIDLSRLDPREALDRHCRNFPPPKAAADFFHTLVQGVLDNRQHIDRTIEEHASHWKIHRMACVDRNILRLAVYEMLFLDDVPLKVSINEAIEIAKRFGTEESGAFINGILDGVARTLGRQANDQQEASADGRQPPPRRPS